MADGFLGRWSRRKLDAKEGRAIEEAPPPAVSPSVTPAAAAANTVRPDISPEAALAPAVAASPGPAPQAAPPEPPPTMADVEALQPDSDFSRFTSAQVSPEVKNAAMKKLFADPRYNVMDGLDIYIDDYGKPDPIPASMLKQLASAEFLGLFRDDETGKKPQENPEESHSSDAGANSGDLSVQQAPQFVAQSGPPESDPAVSPAHDADPDLRLQQDPAPGSQGSGGGAQ